MRNSTLPSVETLLDLLLRFEVELADLATEVATLEDQDAITNARGFVQLRQLKDRLEEVLKPFTELHEKMKTEKLPAAFDRDGVPTINLDEGYRVTVGHRVFAAIKGGKKNEAIEWLRKNGLGDVVSETINSSTLSAVARTMADDNQELPGDYFNVAIVPNSSVTKTSK